MKNIVSEMKEKFLLGKTNRQLVDAKLKSSILEFIAIEII